MAYLCKRVLKVVNDLKDLYRKTGKEFPLNTKEIRYLAYRYHKKNYGKNIGQICNDLKTTVPTLLGKTIPHVSKYLKDISSES